MNRGVDTHTDVRSGYVVTGDRLRERVARRNIEYPVRRWNGIVNLRSIQSGLQYELGSAEVEV